MTRAARAAAVLAVAVALALFSAPARAADSGWVIKSFDVLIQIQNDGRVLVTETLNVDFGSLDKHGIFRDIPVKYDWANDPHKVRV